MGISDIKKLVSWHCVSQPACTTKTNLVKQMQVLVKMLCMSVPCCQKLSPFSHLFELKKIQGILKAFVKSLFQLLSRIWNCVCIIVQKLTMNTNAVWYCANSIKNSSAQGNPKLTASRIELNQVSKKNSSEIFSTSHVMKVAYETTKNGDLYILLFASTPINFRKDNL